MKEPEFTTDWIERYNEGDLDEAEKTIFEARMQSDPLLRYEVYIDASLNRFLMDGELIDLMEKVRSVSGNKCKNGRLLNYLLIAASLLCLLMISGLFYVFRNSPAICNLSALPAADQRPVSADEPGPPDTSIRMIAPFTRDLLATDFKPLPEFEIIAGAVTRSHLMNLISPNAKTIVSSGTDLVFEWTWYDKAVPVSIIIFNNQGDRVSATEVLDTTSVNLKTNVLADGLYYWKILADGELVIAGRFITLTVTKH